MSKTKETEPEKDFQTKANEYAETSIENLREMVFALEHAQECEGTVECDTCAGSGTVDTDHDNLKAGDPCPACKGEGTMTCKEGHDSDEPESWHDAERARERIQEDALSVEVRSDWYAPGDSDAAKPSEYTILLTTGGPAARIIGDLSSYGEPTSARFEFQDWFKPWTVANTASSDDAVMLTYAQQFYFGEGA